MKRIQAEKEEKNARKKKDMSVSELSKLMLKGFSDIDKKFVNIDKRFEDADMRHDDLAGMVARGFTEIHSDMKDMEERLGGRITVLDHKVDRLRDSVNEISYDSHKKTTRIENLELKVFGSIQEA